MINVPYSAGKIFCVIIDEPTVINDTNNEKGTLNSKRALFRRNLKESQSQTEKEFTRNSEKYNNL